MKLKILLLLILGVAGVGFSQPADALTLTPQESLWVGIKGENAPLGFDGMTLFFGWDARQSNSTNLSYEVYRPFPASGSVETDHLSVDLSPFQGKDVFFKFTNESVSENIALVSDKVKLWGDETIQNGRSEVITDESLYFAFYDQVASHGWENRVVDKYVAGEMIGEPNNASMLSLFFYENLTQEIQQKLDVSSGVAYLPLRADFGAVPEPSSIVLLASGVMGFVAVLGKKRTVGKRKGRITVIRT
jgi:hypothetical protein